jgi:hypothetical protein
MKPLFGPHAGQPVWVNKMTETRRGRQAGLGPQIPMTSSPTPS